MCRRFSGWGLSPGLRGEVVFVGKASRVMLTRIAAHRSANVPTFLLPNIRFDKVLVKFIHPDRLEATYQSLVAEHSLRYNPTPSRHPNCYLGATAMSIERRKPETPYIKSVRPMSREDLEFLRRNPIAG